ncbi:MAG: RnfABCDGE type electron transport complex subunit G [Myxococcales bacterium]|nr:RnfABCDGE type electron transport complex subunit G [Myxococcales bacterium]
MSEAPNTQEPKEPSGARLALTLAFAGLISGVALVFTYELTKPVIARNREAALRAAVGRVVPGAKSMRKLVWRDGALQPASAADKDAAVLIAFDARGAAVGFAIVTEGPGFQDTIRLIYGFDASTNTITGMEVLESRETPGLGDKIYKDPDFVKQFKKLSVQPSVKLVKKGKGSGTANEVDAITGATISSKAVIKIINTADKTWRSRLGTVDRNKVRAP